MFMLKRNNILPDLYNGHSGTHLTAYLPGVDSTSISLKDQIEKIIWHAERLLSKEQSPDFIKKFLHPIRRLANEPELITNPEDGGWVLFRTSTSFRLKWIPIKPPKLSVVAKSFHVKPILKWAQSEKECYVLSLTKNEVLLFEASLGDLRHIGTMPIIPEFYQNPGERDLTKLQFKYAAIDWIEDWIFESIYDSSKPLILAGQENMVNSYRIMSRCPNILNDHIKGTYEATKVKELRRALNKLLHKAAGKELGKAVKQLNRAKRKGLVEFDLQKIAKMAVRGDLKRLYIAEDHYIWGVLDKFNGSLTIHSQQKNCQDDDILDDLAEVALKHGAEVVLLPGHKLPNQTSIAAIIKSPTQQLQQQVKSLVVRGYLPQLGAA